MAVTLGTGGTVRFVLDNWVTFDGSYTGSGFDRTIELATNGVSGPSVGPTFMYDNFPSNVPSTNPVLTPGDGYFLVEGFPAVNAGDTVTLTPATYTLGMTDSFNPQATQTFTGNMFIASDHAKLSNDVSAVPEPTSAALLGLGLCAVLGARRKQYSR